MLNRLVLAAALALGTGPAALADAQYGIDVDPADLLYMMGQHAAGTRLEMGRGGPADPPRAVLAYRKAALLGYPLAQNRLGWLYESGRGVPQDFVTAYAWYAIAASRGDENALGNRDALARRLTPNALLEAQALARQMVRQMH